jgi:hypothetical protein
MLMPETEFVPASVEQAAALDPSNVAISVLVGT